VLSRAVDADLSGFDAGLIVTARYWKTAFRYGSFAYRLCTQEAGLVSGNALLVLSALQMRTTLRLLFVDRDVNALLGVGLPTESALALLPFAASVRTVSVSEFSAEQLTLCREPAESGLDAARFWRLLKLEASSHLTALTPASWPQAPTVCDGEHRSTATDAVMGNMRLADALWRRSSGDVYFAPIARSLAISTVRDIAVAATAALDSDLGSYRPRHSVYLALNRVSGLTPGIYQACRSCRDIHAVLQGDVAVRLQAAYMQHAVNCAAAPIVAFIVADTKTWFGLFGDRGYRLMNIEAGVIAQRIAIACATHDLVARCTDAFQEDACANLLGIDATSKVSLFQIVIGEERKGAGGNGRYRLPLRF
jgi:SagB-type dehydrogenase family enzyme